MKGGILKLPLLVLNDLREELLRIVKRKYQNHTGQNKWTTLRDFYKKSMDNGVTELLRNKVKNAKRMLKDDAEGYFPLLEIMFRDAKSGSHLNGEDPSLEKAEYSTSDFEPHVVTQSTSLSSTSFATVPSDGMEDDLAEEDLLEKDLEEASRDCKRRKISNEGRKVEPPKNVGQENCGVEPTVNESNGAIAENQNTAAGLRRVADIRFHNPKHHLFPRSQESASPPLHLTVNNLLAALPDTNGPHRRVCDPNAVNDVPEEDQEFEEVIEEYEEDVLVGEVPEEPTDLVADPAPAQGHLAEGKFNFTSTAEQSLIPYVTDIKSGDDESKEKDLQILDRSKVEHEQVNHRNLKMKEKEANHEALQDFSITKCIVELRNLEGLDPTEKARAFVVFKSVENREIFLNAVNDKDGTALIWLRIEIDKLT